MTWAPLIGLLVALPVAIPMALWIESHLPPRDIYIVREFQPLGYQTEILHDFYTENEG
jgi:hypothetical protein